MATPMPARLHENSACHRVPTEIKTFRHLMGTGIKRMREAYSRDVAALPPHLVQNILVRGGFESPVPFFQSGLIHAWYAKRKGFGIREADTKS